MNARVEIGSAIHAVWKRRVWYACIMWPASTYGKFPHQYNEMYTRPYRSRSACKRAIKRFLQRNNLTKVEETTWKE